MRYAPVAPTRLDYAPSPGQLAFHQDRYLYDERLLACGSGGGKTYSMVFEVLDWCLENPAPGTVLYGMPTVPMFKKAVPDTWRLLTGKELGARGTLGEGWNKSDRLLTLPNGWQIWFVTVEDPTNIEGPPAVDLVALDEARVVRHMEGEDGAWAQLTRRLRGKANDGRRRGAIMGTHSPSRAILNLFKARKVTRWRAPGPSGDLGWFEVAACEEPNRRAYQWNTASAVAWRTLSKTGADNILRGLTTEAARQRVWEGRFARASGTVYAAYDEALHLRPPPARWDYCTGGIDWGWDMTALTAHAWGPSTVHTVDEDGGEHWSLVQIARAMQRLERQWGRMVWWCGHDRPDSAKELASIDVGEPGHPEVLHFEVRPYSGKVMDGVGILQTKLQVREWSIAPKCRLLRHDMDNYVMDPDHGEPDKAAYDAHHADSARYGICGPLKGTRRGGITW